MSKLLNKPFKTFTLYALLILISSIPVYYWVVDSIWLDELDKQNKNVSERVVAYTSKSGLTADELTATLNACTSIVPGTRFKKIDQISGLKPAKYTVTRFEDNGKEEERYRGLKSYLQINGQSFELNVETNVEEVAETLTAIAIVTFTMFVLLVAGFLILNRRIARNIWKPFHSTLLKLKKFDLTNSQHINFEKTNIEEFEALNFTLTQLIESNIAVFHQQKSFIENASHELQTPLAVVRSKVDLLLQNDHLTVEQSEIISAISQNLSRVSRINKNLLLLAKIENNQFPAVELVDVESVVAEINELLSDYMKDKNIHVKPNYHSKILTCNRTLLEVLITNLMVNAILHGNRGDEISIDLSATAMKFSNPGLISLDGQKLFKRFAISSEETTNSGLGLAIAKEICNKYGWKLLYQFDEKSHVFSVKF